ncbi:RNA polymerase sigma factor [Agromyces sp. GXS1127]|uniref:RNA polymerase sigma factor n=1 Tax=Agromyces sp. GXS1127 TaxID=3424181 RepID=UPI003D314699
MIGRRRVDDHRLTAAYTANATDLLTYFGRRVDATADAADLLGETFLIATRRRNRLPADDEQARMWLFGIARNVLANATRGVARQHQFTARLAEHIAVMPPEDPGDRAIDVRTALDGIPADQAELVRLVLWDGFTVPQAAVVVGISESTARGRYQRARANLRTRLHDYEHERSHG